MTVAALDEQMGAEELVHWSAYFELEADESKRRQKTPTPTE